MNRRGTELSPTNRFERISIEVDDYCDRGEDESGSAPKTELFWDDTRSIVTENDSPDIPFRYSLNPYRGCEHGCAYCYARPYHEYLGFNAGVDFETKILVKSNAATLLSDWLKHPKWDGREHLMMSGVTDPYQPIERKLKVTRSLLAVCAEFGQAISIITKNALVTRDIDILQELASSQSTHVTVSITTLDKNLAMALEPRCSVPAARLRAIRELSDAGIPVHVNFAPIIPGLNDHECGELLKQVADHGAYSSSWVLLRLPGAVESVFLNWLERFQPHSQQKIKERLSRLRRGRLNETRFKYRMKGDGPFIKEWSKLFDMLLKKNQLQPRPRPLEVTAFRKIANGSRQLYLF